jgi:hypothetical protein
VSKSFELKELDMATQLDLRKLATVLALGISAAGCDSSSNSGKSGRASMGEMAAALDAKRAANQKEQARLETERKAEEARQAAAAAATPPAERPRKVAGRAPVGEGGYLTAIVGARRHALNKIDSWPWMQAVQHFVATEGRKPKDHDEFMKKIVIPLQLDLGYIEENQEFLYDPNAEREDGLDIGQLYVVEKVAQPVPNQGPTE